MAFAAMVPRWWLRERVPAKLLESTLKRMQDLQRDEAKARRSQIKRTRRKLREIGIKLTKTHRCRWDTS